jgi:DNA polymerase III subunit delta
MIPTRLRKALGEEPGGVFYLFGPDEYRKEEAARALVEAHLDPGTRDFNFDLMRGSEVGVEQLASVLGTPPMMAEWRVVLLREAQALAAVPRARTLLLDTLAAPPPGLALVILCTPPPRSGARFYKDLERQTRSLEFQSPHPNDLPAWLMGWSVESFGCTLEEDAARLLAQGVGADLGILALELEKLVNVVGEGETITRRDVEAVGIRVPRQDRWEWFDLVGERRYTDALRGLPVLLDHGETGVGLTIGLATHLLRLGLALEGGGRALESVLQGNQKWLVRKYVAQARGWDPEQLQSALQSLLTVDRLLKASRFPDVHLLESWLLERMVDGEVRAA